MALEWRNGRVYCYTSRRVGRAVVREYRGYGLIATLGDRLDQCRREQRKYADIDRRAMLERLTARNARLRKWLGKVAAAVGEALTAAGWHQHRREWRKKRGATMGTLATVPTADRARGTWVSGELAAMAGELPAATRERAAKGDKSVVPEVVAFVDGNPAAAALWGDMGRRVLQRWIESYAGDCQTTRRAVWRFASDLRAGLVGPNPGVLDYLLAERVVLGWVFLHWAEAQYARQLPDMTWDVSGRHTKRIEMAHRNLMTACRTLAKVKKSKLPDVLALVNVNPPRRPATSADGTAGP